MSNNNAIRSAVRHALCVGTLATAVGYAPQTLAQADDTVEEITVTGSRIRRQDYNSASPISTVDAEMFNNTGAPTIETVLNTLPPFVPSITSTSNNPSNGGQANVALRGLESKRTLVLMDGRRITPSNPTGVVDLNLIPASIIQSVEIITGGASAVYGSDAIAGVVNIKTRQFVGLELTAGYGQTGESDGERTSFGITGGLESDDGGSYAWGSFNWAERDGIIQGARQFSEVALDWDGSAFQPLGSSTIRQGRWDSLTANQPTQAALDTYFAAQDPSYVAGTALPGHNFGFNPDGSLFDVNPVINFTGDTAEPLQPVNPASYTYNYAPPNYLELPLERLSFFGRAGSRLTENTEVYAQVMWADYSADQQLAPTPASSLYIQPNNPNLDAAMQALLASRPDPTAPFRYRKRMIESGPRISVHNDEVIQIVAGAKGEFGFAPEWSWDAYGSWGSMEDVNQQLGNVSRSAFYDVSLTPDNGASQCGGTALNPVGIASLQPECVALWTKSAVNQEQVKQKILEAFTTGPMFSMPAGDAMAAVGFMYKDDDYAFLPDASLTASVVDPVTGSTITDIVGFNAQQPVRGNTTSKEAYLEASFPLLADMTAVQSLDLTVGYRYADHNIVGGMSSYKIEGTWDITDSFGFRGGYQRALRAPNISELFRPATINFPSVGLGDPCSNDFNDPSGAVQSPATGSAAAAALCNAQGIPPANLPAYQFTNTQFQGLSGGNPTLTEETADTYTFGAIWRGDGDGFFGNISASVDYYQIEIEDIITAIDADVIVERCFDPAFNPNLDNNNQFCQLFTRDAGTSEIIDVAEIDNNLAADIVKGVDVQIDWSQDVGAGTMHAKWISTHLLEWQEQITSSDPFEEFAGTASDSFDVLAEMKSTFTVGYGVGGFDGDVRWRYIGDTVDTSFADFKLDSMSYFDVTAGYDFTGMVEGLRVRAGVTNISDEQPIIYPSQQQANTDPATYDVLGRRWFMNLTYTFQ